MRRAQATCARAALAVAVAPLVPIPRDALAAPAIPNPGIETRFDIGLGTVISPSRPVYENGPEGAVLKSAESAYSAIVGRARWLIPLETEGITYSGGLALSLHAGQSSLALTPARGPDGRYFSEYGFLGRAEFDLAPFVVAGGLAMMASRADYAELSVRTVEPHASVEARGTFRSFEVLDPSLSPELQLEGRISPAFASYSVNELDEISPENAEGAPYRARESGDLSSFAVDAALGVRYTASESKPGRPVREGAVVVGASYANRTFSKFLIETSRAGAKESDATGETTTFFLSLQGFMP